MDQGYDVYYLDGSHIRFEKEIRTKMMFVALAVPVSNIVLAILAAFIYLRLGLFMGALGDLGAMFFNYLIMINVFLAAFNMLPIPPLDGSKVLGMFLSDEAYWKWTAQERKGMIYLFVIIIASNLLGLNLVGRIVLPPVRAFMGLLGIPF